MYLSEEMIINNYRKMISNKCYNCYCSVYKLYIMFPTRSRHTSHSSNFVTCISTNV